ncbi:GOLPH3/VPS74 family protein [Sphaerisporangium corydalis]|uniref:GPP34 family phosphoprotein n=1 Tax=Sphaerisporangium corydalis TaxID=1441875 RepID=A0ABV9EL67_9ACTN|nr:GPP34 family phosphoprotein [Sphaerisporangium corydalis]
MPESLYERIYLLAYDTERGQMAERWHLDLLIRAAVLAELMIQGHLADATGGPVVRTPALSDPLLDGVLQQIAHSRRRSWQHWVSKGSRATVRGVRERLESGGWIRVEHGRFLGVLPTTKVSVRDTRVVKGLVSTASTALRGGQPAARLDPRDAALAALAATVRLRTVRPRAQWRAVRGRSDELSEVVAPVPRALRKAIQAAAAAAAG